MQIHIGRSGTEEPGEYYEKPSDCRDNARKLALTSIIRSLNRFRFHWQCMHI